MEPLTNSRGLILAKTKKVATIEPPRSQSTLNKAHQKNMQSLSMARGNSGIRIRAQSNVRKRPPLVANASKVGLKKPFVAENAFDSGAEIAIDLPKTNRVHKPSKIPTLSRR